MSPQLRARLACVALETLAPCQTPSEDDAAEIFDLHAIGPDGTLQVVTSFCVKNGIVRRTTAPPSTHRR